MTPVPGTPLERIIGKFGPWFWVVVACLVHSSVLNLGNVGIRPCFGACIVLPSFVVLPVFLGCVGGYYRNWWVSTLGVLAIPVALHVGEFISLSTRATVFAPSIIPASDDLTFLSILGAVMLVFSVIAHLVAQPRLRRHFPPGHCQNCGYNLKGNESGTCPECGSAV